MIIIIIIKKIEFEVFHHLPWVNRIPDSCVLELGGKPKSSQNHKSQLKRGGLSELHMFFMFIYLVVTCKI